MQYAIVHQGYAMTDYSLLSLKPLTASQYDNVKSQAMNRVQNRIGAKPTRQQFKREYAPLFGVLDVLAQKRQNTAVQ